MHKFSFEELSVWQKAVDFTKVIIGLTDTIETNRKHYRLIEQLEACSSSIALNIAEGKGRYSKKEFLYIARGSLFEVVTLLTIFYKNNWIAKEKPNEMRNIANEIGTSDKID